MRALLIPALLGLACGPVASEHGNGGASDAGVPFAVEVVSFTAGEGAGFGQDGLPDIVLGAPRGEGRNQGSLHVLSLGKGGEIVLRMGVDVDDGPGPDFIVFENAFAVSQGGHTFAEPGEVSVSEDGVTFTAFPCTPTMPFTGCAGVQPTLASGEEGSASPNDPSQAGGDAFDLADVGLARARFIRITDRTSAPALGNNAGFDLDAVAAVLTRLPEDP